MYESELKSYEVHHDFAGAMGSWSFCVDGDVPAGHEITYTTSGLTVPIRNPMPITLYALKAEVKVIATGYQLAGVPIWIWAHSNPNGGPIFLKTGQVTPWAGNINWIGALPLDWGYGVTVMTNAGIGATHKLVLNAIYSHRKVGLK